MSAAAGAVRPARRVLIDTTKCSGHGRCYTIAPQVFDPDDEGFPVVLQEIVHVDGADFSAVLDAVDNCPERAISLTDEA